MRILQQLNQDFFGQEKLLPRLFLLTFVKESYLLLTNFYGFLVHPYLTLKRISNDHSQLAIFVGLWFGGWLGILGILGVFWLIIPRFFPEWKRLAFLGQGIGVAGTFFLLVVSLYLAYWLAVFLRKREK